MDGAARGFHLVGALLDVIDSDIAHPRRAHAHLGGVLRNRHQAADHVFASLEQRVFLSVHRVRREGPADDFGIELLRPGKIVRHLIIPDEFAEHVRLNRVGHSFLLQIGAAAFICVMSSFFMLMTARITRSVRCASPLKSSGSARGTICQETPNLSVSQPHWTCSPPFASFSHSASISAWSSQLTMSDSAGVNL